MGLNETPSANRTHIGFFGCRNAGKSSVVNAVTAQDMAVVSDKKGTTTDPVTKSMEILPLGPVVIIDTPGFDDTGELGGLRVKRTRQILGKTDIAVLVVDGCVGMNNCDKELTEIFETNNIPYIVAYNKSDIAPQRNSLKKNEICISAKNNSGIDALKEMLAGLADSGAEKRIAGDLINAGDTVVLVIPIDSSAPKGRLILPQQQTIRDILDAGAIAAVTRETELEQTLTRLKEPPALVITDSQAFGYVSRLLPPDIPLTSFSILMARFKGLLASAVHGVRTIENLKDGDVVLIAEGCTHHRQCEDIGTVKLPKWLREYTNKNIKIETSSGAGFPEDLSKYSLIIHCGGCMLNEREVLRRVKYAGAENVPITNYGTAIAYMNGILKRSLGILPELQAQI